ncbi:MAG: PadR family transcriptional regulator [Thermoguttaceae bacterium]
MSTPKLSECEEDDLKACPCVGGTLDKLVQPAILAVLAEGPLHGYGLARRIAALPAFAGDRPDVSGIYRFLKAMHRKGLVESTWGVSESGPAKKTYQITATGRQCLRLWVRTLQHHHQVITALLRTARKAAGK